MKYILFFVSMMTTMLMLSCSSKMVGSVKQITTDVVQYSRADFEVEIPIKFSNPYDFREVQLDMELQTPSGKIVLLPCYYSYSSENTSVWKARFAPQESGTYSYLFKLKHENRTNPVSEISSFISKSSSTDGFLHVNDYWTLKFDSGKPFRGIGENICWESRSYENAKWTYDYLLPTLSNNGANFFRTWMCPWNLPVNFKNVMHTDRYSNSTEYFNPEGVERMDEFIEMIDSLGIYLMLSIDSHGSLMPDGHWDKNNHNVANGGPAKTPTEFFTNDESKAMYKNRLRYMVARWGYSKGIAAWEFFNEIDNAVFTPTPHDSVLIPHAIITSWHDEMSTYLKGIDPYDHIVTTSISHRDIEGLNSLLNIDINQKHIYNKTHIIPNEINDYVTRHNKPYVIGEFGYDWNWDNVKHELGAEFEYDYKRGLWYGLFSPTPIVPMTWWWEFFDERKMTPYFKSVREIHNLMMASGDGKFVSIESSAPGLTSIAVKCGSDYYVYLLNDTSVPVTTSVRIQTREDDLFEPTAFVPDDRTINKLEPVKPDKEGMTILVGPLAKQESRIIILRSLFIRANAK